MTYIESLQAELAELARLLADAPEAAPFSVEWLNRQSLLARDAQVRHAFELAAGRYDLEVILSGQAVHESAISARIVGRFIDEVQATLSAIAQVMMVGPGERGPVGADVVSQSDLQLVATAPGSFLLGFNGPRRFVQPALSAVADDQVELLPVFDEALGKFLDVLDVAEYEVTGDHLPQSLAALGGHRPIIHLLAVARLLASNQTAATMVQRSPFLRQPREARVSASGARRLETLLSRSESSTQTIVLRGQLSGVRWRSGLFDLELEESGELISGRVARELRDEVRGFFDSPVEATIERVTIKTQIEGEESVQYHLVDLRSAQ